MPNLPNPDSSPHRRSSERDDASDLAKQISAGAREASSPDDFGALSEKLRRLAELMKPLELQPVVKGRLDPERDAAFLLPARRDSMVSSIAFDSGGTKIAVLAHSGELDVYSATATDDAGTAVRLYSNTIKRFCSCDRIAFTPSGDEVAFRGIEKGSSLEVVSTSTYGWFGRPKTTLRHGSSYSVNDFAVSPDGTCIATACSDSRIRLLDNTAGKRRGEVTSEIAIVANPIGVKFSSDGNRLFVTDRGPRGEIGTYLADLVHLAGDRRSLENGVMGKLDCTQGPRSVTPSPDLERVAIATASGIEIFEIGESSSDTVYRMSFRKLCSLPESASAVSPTFSKDGKIFAFADESGKVVIHELSGLDRDQPPVEIAHYQSPSWVTDVRFSEDCDSIAIGSQNGSVVVLSLRRR